MLIGGTNPGAKVFSWATVGCVVAISIIVVVAGMISAFVGSENGNIVAGRRSVI
jgi:hypothetical protein